LRIILFINTRMDKRETRYYLGEVHYAPHMNPQPPPKKHWFFKDKPRVDLTKAKNIAVQKQLSRQDSTEECGSPPVGSPGAGSPPISMGSPPPHGFQAEPKIIHPRGEKLFMKEFDFNH